jgi:hypothetical protein
MRFVRPGSPAQVMRACVIAALSSACGRAFFDPIHDDAGSVSDVALTCMLKAPLTHATSASPRSIAVGDVDRDGRLDLVTASQTANVVSVLLGNGNGAFQSKTDSAIAATPYSIELADTTVMAHFAPRSTTRSQACELARSP